MEFVVLNVGWTLASSRPAVFSMLVLMALSTTAAITPFLRWVYPEQVPVRAMPLSSAV
jgi:hypothetical protein